MDDGRTQFFLVSTDICLYSPSLYDGVMKELEKEAGGSGLRYSFDVAAAGATYEVGVDAKSGKVLENKREGAHPD